MKKGRTSTRLELMPYGNHFGPLSKGSQALRRCNADFVILPADAIRRSFSTSQINRTPRGYSFSDALCIAGIGPERLQRFGLIAPIGSRTSGREDITLGVAVNHGPNRISESR